MTDYTIDEMYEKGDREEKMAMSRVIEMVCPNCGMTIWVFPETEECYECDRSIVVEGRNE